MKFYYSFMVWLGASEPEGNELRELKQWLVYILLGFMIISFCPMYFWLYDFYYRQDIVAIEHIYKEFYQGLEQGNYKVAYGYMSPSYRDKCSLSQFVWDFESYNPPLSSYYYLKFSGNQAILYPGFKYSVIWSGSEYELIKLTDNKWYFTGEYIRYLDYTGYKNFERTCPH